MRTLAALSLAALAAGCNVTNDKVLIAMLVQSPTPPAGWGVTATPVSAAQVFLGQTSVVSPSAGDVKPISGATVKLVRTPVGGTATEVATLTETQPGFYEATGNFYQATATFRFTAQVGSDQYWGEVQNAPSAPAMTLPPPTSSPLTGVYQYASYALDMPSPFNIQRICPGICDVAFYGAWTVSGTSVSGTPNCTNAPQDAASVLQFAFLDDTAWRLTTFGVSKATCFPQPGTWPGEWLVGLAALKKGSTSGNTSMLSTVYAGTSAAAGVIATGP